MLKREISKHKTTSTMGMPIGDYSYSGRDSLIFLVDASRAMFESQDEDELTPFDMSIQVRLPFH